MVNSQKKWWIEKVCTIASEAEKKYGSVMAEKIHQRIDEIDVSDTVEEMVQYHIGRCHPLKKIAKVNTQWI